MIPVLMVWLYFALMISVMQWPNVMSMILTFVLLGGIPVFMLYRLFVLKRKQNRPHRNEPGKSMHAGMGKIDQQNPGED